MKELSIKEKAKRYDDAIERAKNTIKVNQTIPDIVECVEFLFPELKESEDERIMKSIQRLISHYYDVNFPTPEGFTREDLMSWIEKQGEHKPTDIDNKFIRMRETKPKDISEFLDRLTTVEQEFLWEHIAKIRELDKEEQKDILADAILDNNEDGLIADTIKKYKNEQKPILDVEIPFGTDSELVEEAITIPDGCYAIIKDNKVILRKGEQKYDWSEEDEYNNNIILYLLNNECVGAEDKRIAIEWFKSLKDRVQPQPKQEWKPSTDQLAALFCAIPYIHCSSTRACACSLYNDLKKLKG